MAPDEPARCTVTVSFSPCAGEVDETVLSLESGATVADALASSGLDLRHPGLFGSSERPMDLAVGVWGERCDRSRRLRPGDRVEVCRPLTVDPKEARRLRHRASTSGRKAPAGEARSRATKPPGGDGPT